MRGGYGSVQLLPHLDGWARCAATPKLFIGYSDNTSILSWLTCQLRHHGAARPDARRPAGAGDRPATTKRSFLALLRGRGPGWRSHRTGSTSCAGARRRGPLFGGTLTQLAASLGTPYAFDPPAGCILFLEDVNERPYRLDRMLTQLQLSGVLGRAGALVFGEMRGCRRAGRRRCSARATSSALITRGFDGPVALRISVRPHHRPVLDAAVRRRASASRPAPQPSLVVEESPLSERKTIHLIGICGTAMATLAALLKQPRARRARLGPERLPADERLPRGGGHSAR